MITTRPSTRTTRKLAAAIIALAFQSLVLAPAQAAVTATVDRAEISEFDVLTLTIRLSGESTEAEPDLSPLERDFEIIDSRTQQSTSFSFINGRQSSTVIKDVELSLRARRKGTLVIPVLMVGTEHTDPIPVRVVEQTANPGAQATRTVFFDTRVDTSETYVQGQVLYTVRLLYADSVAGDFPPAPDVDDAVVETLESEKRYETTVDYRRYYVLEKQYAIYPQHSGTLTIPREAFVGTLGRGGLFSTRSRVTAVSKPITITVKPIPESFTGDHWIAAKDFRLEETWSQQPVFRVGEPVNRTLTMTATGVATSQLPLLPDLVTPNAKVYADPPENTEYNSEQGIVATSVSTVGIVPVTAGELELPEVRIPWWNTTTDREAVAVIPARRYQVMPALPGARVNPPVPAAGDDTGESTPAASPFWPIVAAGLGLGWALSLAAWWFTSRSRTSARQEALASRLAAIDDDEAIAFRRLEEACKRNEAKAALHALGAWARMRFPVASLAELTRTLDDRSAAGLLAGEVAGMEKAVYGSGEPADWRGATLLALARDLRARRTTSARPSALARLNPV